VAVVTLYYYYYYYYYYYNYSTFKVLSPLTNSQTQNPFKLFAWTPWKWSGLIARPQPTQDNPKTERNRISGYQDILSDIYSV
jgi:hypothetical protein